MKNILADPGSNRSFSFMMGLIALVVSFCLSRLDLSSGVLSDAFHHGEYFAALSSLVHNSGMVPLTVHGALDYLPGALALYFFGEDYYFFGTEFGYVLFEFGSAIVLFLIVSRFSLSSLQLFVAALVIPLFAGYRDFSLVLLLWGYFIAIDESNNARKILFLLALGLAGAFNFFWSTNRGFAGTVAVGSALLILSFFDRRYLFSIVAFVAFVLGISLLHPVFSLPNYFENISIWSQVSYQWGYGLQFYPVRLYLFHGVTFLVMGYLIVSQAIRNGSRESSANAVMFVLIFIFYFQISAQRADYTHSIMGIVAFFAGLTYWAWGKSKTKMPLSLGEYAVGCFLIFALLWYYYTYRDYMSALLVVYLVVVFIGISGRFLNAPLASRLFFAVSVLFVSAGVYGVSVDVKSGSYAWVRYLFKVPNNSEISTAPIKWVSAQLQDKKVSCVFDLTNSGVINGLSGIPACSRFSYIVYADRRFEAELIDTLVLKDPSVIVYWTDYWSYAIDGRSMASRFPKLDAVVKLRYMYQWCEHGYCLRSRLPFWPGQLGDTGPGAVRVPQGNQ